VRRRRRAPVPRGDPRRVPLRDRWRRAPVGRPLVQLAHARALREEWVNPCEIHADVPAGPRRPDQLGDAGASRVSVIPGSCSATAPSGPRRDDRADASPSPRPGVMPIEADAYPTSWSRSVFESELDQVRSGTREYLVARRGRTVVGYAGLWIVPTPTAHQAHVTNVAVDPITRRRTGVATALLVELADDVRSSGAACRGRSRCGRRAPARRSCTAVRVRAGRRPPEVLRERRGRDRHVVPRHPPARVPGPTRGALSAS
jgi:hypothetical protein